MIPLTNKGMKAESLRQYISELNQQYKTGLAREHSYRPALKDLLQSLLSQMVVTNETEQLMQEIDL